ncbi:hypothetical protein ACA910_019355 [Epithemia clementina (nom. ined.)]
MNSAVDSSSPSANDLEAPLLEKMETVDLVEEGKATSITSSSEALPEETKASLNTLSIGTGAFIGLMSQVILSSSMWDQSILNHPMRDLLVFSLSWSLCTCLIVNCAMALFVRDMKASFYRPQNEADDQEGGEENEWDDAASTMEAYVIGGSLLSISSWWLILDLGTIALPMATSCIVGIVIAATILYIFFIALAMPSKNGIPAWWNCLVASILGLVVGFGSQSCLSYFFWAGLLPQPAFSNLFIFSMLWSACTIGLTFFGCMALRCLKPENDSAIAAERAYLRMESFYVLCSLVGISFAWISLDVVLGLTQQIVPSVLMLLASLLLFRVILYCFPEEKCLEEFANEKSAVSASCKLLP